MVITAFLGFAGEVVGLVLVEFSKFPADVFFAGCVVDGFEESASNDFE